MTQVKTQANWKITKNFPDHDLRVRVSEKGAIQVQQIAPSGEAYQVFCLPLKAMESFLNIAGEVGNMFLEPEFKALVEAIPLAKEQAKQKAAEAREANKAVLQIQAATERLKSLGYEVLPTKKQA